MKTIYIALTVDDDVDIFNVHEEVLDSFAHLTVDEEHEPTVYENFEAVAKDVGTEPTVGDVLEITDATDKIYFSRHYGTGETETHDFDLADTFGAGLYVHSTNKQTGARGSAHVSLKPVWEAACAAAVTFEQDKD